MNIIFIGIWFVNSSRLFRVFFPDWFGVGREIGWSSIIKRVVWTLCSNLHACLFTLLWFPLRLHDAGSGLRLGGSPCLGLSLLGYCLMPVFGLAYLSSSRGFL